LISTHRPLLDHGYSKTYPCLHILAPETLRHDAILADALDEIEAVTNETNVDAVMGGLLSKPGLLEFVLSGKCCYVCLRISPSYITVSPTLTCRLCHYLLDSFPVSADAFDSSLVQNLLFHFWSYLFALCHSFPPDVSAGLDNCRTSVKQAPSILQAISAMLISDMNKMDPLVQVGSRSKGKRGRCASTAIDAQPFKKLGMEVPNTLQAAE